MTQVLIADDMQNVRQLLRMILAPYYEIVEARDGLEALELAIEHCPRIAVLDIRMPGRTGLEVCRAMRGDPRTRDIGVVVITANGTPNNREDALAAGANAFFTKPFSPALMLRVIDDLIARGGSEPA